MQPQLNYSWLPAKNSTNHYIWNTSHDLIVSPMVNPVLPNRYFTWSPENICDFSLRIYLGRWHWEMPGSFGEFSVVPFPTKQSKKKCSKISGKFGAFSVQIRDEDSKIWGSFPQRFLLTLRKGKKNNKLYVACLGPPFLTPKFPRKSSCGSLFCVTIFQGCSQLEASCLQSSFFTYSWEF